MRLARIPVSRSNCQRSVSPGPLMLTRIVRHIFRTARSTNFKLGTRMEDDDPHQPQAHDLQGQRSRSQGHVICLSRLGPMMYLCHWRPAGGIPCRPIPAATLLVDYKYVSDPSVQADRTELHLSIFGSPVIAASATLGTSCPKRYGV